MIGDKLIITDYHRDAARRLLPGVLDLLEAGTSTVAVSIAGESGCGKTELAACLADALGQARRRSLVLGQDDYFRLPPKTNHEKRLRDIDWVGPGEVHLDLMSAHVAVLKSRPGESVIKPLVDFDGDRIDTESIRGCDVDVIIAEGTYTSLLDGIDLRVFIDRTFHQTRKNRLCRNRDRDPEFLERVLEIEHREISAHRPRANVVIDAPQNEQEAARST